MTQLSRTQSMVLIGLGIALISVGAFITIPFGPVPFTLQTLMVGIVICLLPFKLSLGAVGGYLVIGMIGFPVFSGMRGGIAVLAGPTGGFLFGFMVAAVIIAFAREWLLAPPQDNGTKRQRSTWFLPGVDIASLIVFSIVYYVFGCLWFMVSTGATLEATLAACLIPFIAADVVKAVIAFVCTQAVRAALGTSLAVAR